MLCTLVRFASSVSRAGSHVLKDLLPAMFAKGKT